MALAMIPAIPSAVHALTLRAGCPLSTEVYPFPEQSRGSYGVEVTDGGPGDVDDAIDGTCLLRARLCLGSGGAAPKACGESRIRSFSASMAGRLDRSVRDATVEHAVEGVSRLFDGPENPGSTVSFATAPLAKDHCVDVPVRVPAEASPGGRSGARLTFVIGVQTAEDTTADYTSRVRIRCRARPPSGRVRTLCRAYGRDCADAEIGRGPLAQTTTTVSFETLKRRRTTTTSVPPSTSTTTTTAPPPPSTSTTVPTTTTTTSPPPSTTSTTSLPSTTTTSEPPSTTTTTTLPPSTTTTSEPPPSTTTTTLPPPTTTTTLPPPPPGDGRVFYLSPSGEDTNTGTSVASPWRTFARVLNAGKLLQPGDTLVLLDGTYTRTTTGLPRIDCGTPGTASSGAAGRPITIRALNERQAHLQSDGLATAFEMSGCSWWVVEGLRASNADNRSGAQGQGFPFRFAQVSNVTGRRLLGSHNNREHNTHVFAVEVSQNVLLEECEAYYFHRHGFSLWRSRYVTLRRCYANSMLYGSQGCCGTPDERNYGDEAVSVYGTSDSIVENCISENRANGFQVHGISSPLDPSGHGGRNNRILGSISRDDSVPALVESRGGSSGTYHNASGNLFRDFLAVIPGGHGIAFRDSADSQADNVTLYGSTSSSGLVADTSGGDLGGTCSQTLVCTTTGASCSSSSDCHKGGVCTLNPQGCSFTARNVLAVNNRQYGIRSTTQQSWLVENANATGNTSNYGSSEPIDDAIGNIRSSMSTTPTGVGLGAGQCIAWVPAWSNMANVGTDGGPVGANVLFRYENGNPTAQPLWDASTGAFPCGAVVPGLNDGAMRCTNVHERLGIGIGGCQFPSGYGG